MPQFIGVYKALYGYTSAGPEELTFGENDILYLLEKAEDGWWTVKKRMAGQANDEPTGIVPKNYIEPAKPAGTAKALYPYEPQTDEEVAFGAGDSFDVYAEDGDWVLVGSGSHFGFAPANYLEMSSAPKLPPKDQQAPATSVAASAPASAPFKPTQTFAAPPVHPQVSAYHASGSTSRLSRDEEDKDDEDIPPPKPPRPSGNAGGRSNTSNGGRPRSDTAGSESRQSSGSRPTFRSWTVQEIDGKSKSKATLSVSETVILLSPDRGPQQQWDAPNLMSYSSEKKHVFLEFQKPRASLDLKTSSQSIGDQIVAALGQVAGASRAAGLTEVLVAAKSAGQRTGKAALNFKAASGRELTVHEGEMVFIVNQKSKEWWLVRNQAGREGLVPASFIDLDHDVEKKTLFNRFGRKNTAGKEREKERERDRERIIEQRSRDDREGRSGGSSSRKDDSRRHSRHSKRASSASSERKMPDSRKIRTWTDRSDSFRVEAALLGSADGKVHLHKANGVKIAVPAAKLSVPDLEYVESVLGISLAEDKPLSDARGRSSQKPATNKGLHRRRSSSSVAATASTVPATHPASSASKQEKVVDFWFDFFLECGVEPNNSQRYATNFARDKMDESVLAEITPPVLRNLGMREGDILRVTKKISEKYGAAKPNGAALASAAPSAAADDGWTPRPEAQPLAPQVTAPAAVAATASVSQPLTAQSTAPTPAVQPLQRSNTAPIQPSQTGPFAKPVTSTPTGALADLLGMTTLQPQTALQPQKTAEDTLASQQRQHQQVILRQQAELQQQQIKLLKEQQSVLKQQQDELTRTQTGIAQAMTGMRTGGLDPFATGVAGGAFGSFGTSAAVLAAPAPPQPRGLVQPFAFQAGPAQAQATGPFQSQATGPFQSQATGPFQSQATGPFQSQATGPFQSQATGPFQSQATGPFQSQATGPFQSQATGPFQSQATGPFQSQATGPFQSQATGSFQSQATGPFQSQFTGPAQPFQSQPPTSFQNQSTGPFQPQTSFQPQNTGPFQQAPFSQPAAQPQHTGGGPFQPLGANRTGGQPTLAQLQMQQTAPVAAVPATVPQTSFSNDPFAAILGKNPHVQPQTQSPAPFSVGQPFSAGQPAAQAASQQSFQQPSFQQPSFQQPSQQQPFQQQPFQQQPFQQQPSFNQPPAYQTQASFSAPAQTFQPSSQFGQALQQQRTGGELQSQPTGFGFGNQRTGGGGNIAAASANNPFGF